eukprot:2223624-Rhodomonas_salina.1
MDPYKAPPDDQGAARDPDPDPGLDDALEDALLQPAPVIHSNPLPRTTQLVSSSALRFMFLNQQHALADSCLRRQLKHRDSPRPAWHPFILNCIWGGYKKRFLALVRADVSRKQRMVNDCDELLALLHETWLNGLTGSPFDADSKHPMRGSLSVYLAFYRDLPTTAPDGMNWLRARTVQLVEEDESLFKRRDSSKPPAFQYRKPCVFAIARTLQALHHFRE